MDQMSIGEVARRAGLRPSAIRYYEEVGVLPPPRRVNGRRVYDGGVLTRLALVRMAQEAGFTVAEIRLLAEGFTEDTPASERWRALAAAKLEEVDAVIARAKGMRRVLELALRCGCLRLEDCAALGWDGGGDEPTQL
jgi:MerR family redox-sensitive transcriptional activator SoxR